MGSIPTVSNNNMKWYDIKVKKPPTYKQLLVRKRFMKADPFYEVDFCKEYNNTVTWEKGARATHWAEIDPPEEKPKKKPKIPHNCRPVYCPKKPIELY